jgi:hypothetical protein
MKHALPGTLCVLMIFSFMIAVDALVITFMDSSMKSVTMVIWGTIFMNLFLFYFAFKIAVATLDKIE